MAKLRNNTDLLDEIERKDNMIDILRQEANHVREENKKLNQKIKYILITLQE